MHAIEINEEIKVYNKLPKSWGNIIAGFDTLPDEELQTHGFYNIITPNYNYATQILGNIYFDSENNFFTYPVTDKTWSQTLEELKSIKISDLQFYTNHLLSDTDWYVTRKYERNIDIPESIQSERETILNNHDTKETEINALTSKAEVVDYEFK